MGAGTGACVCFGIGLRRLDPRHPAELGPDWFFAMSIGYTWRRLLSRIGRRPVQTRSGVATALEDVGTKAFCAEAALLM